MEATILRRSRARRAAIAKYTPCRSSTSWKVTCYNYHDVYSIVKTFQIERSSPTRWVHLAFREAPRKLIFKVAKINFSLSRTPEGHSCHPPSAIDQIATLIHSTSGRNRNVICAVFQSLERFRLKKSAEFRERRIRAQCECKIFEDQRLISRIRCTNNESDERIGAHSTASREGFRRTPRCTRTMRACARTRSRRQGARCIST